VFAVLLDDGRVAVFEQGGWIELYDPSLRWFVPAGRTPDFVRQVLGRGPAPLVLDDGRVLVLGGPDVEGPGRPLRLAVWSPADGSWEPVGPEGIDLVATARLDDQRAIVRGKHAAWAVDMTPQAGSLGGVIGLQPYAQEAVALADGRVLVLDGLEVFEPATGAFHPIDPMGQVAWPSASMSVTRLADGRVLITGVRESSEAPSTGWLFDPGSETFIPTGPMMTKREQPGSALLSDGRVLVVGGTADGARGVLSSAEIFDPTTNAFEPAASMRYPRLGATAIPLDDGSVLVVDDQTPGSSSTDSAAVRPELYLPDAH
jgi:hypothetical protein